MHFIDGITNYLSAPSSSFTLQQSLKDKRVANLKSTNLEH